MLASLNDSREQSVDLHGNCKVKRGVTFLMAFSRSESEPQGNGGERCGVTCTSSGSGSGGLDPGLCQKPASECQGLTGDADFSLPTQREKGRS
jgi:hypothetical protein